MKTKTQAPNTYWKSLWKRFKLHRLGYAAFCIVLIFMAIGIYAPFLAASKPFSVYYEGSWYFPLFRYLFYKGYYTKNIDIFFNLLIFILPAALVAWKTLRYHSRMRWIVLTSLIALQAGLFFYIILSKRKDPAANPQWILQRHQALKNHPLPDWNFDLSFMTPYAKLNLLLKQQQYLLQHQQWLPYQRFYTQYAEQRGLPLALPSLWEDDYQNEQNDLHSQEKILETEPPFSDSYQYAQAKIKYIKDRNEWIQKNLKELKYEVMPVIRYFHWEDDAGGDQNFNQFLPWWRLTRINHKDLLSALIFGIRISLLVGIVSVGIALLIGIPIGAFAGYYGGTFDIIVSRLLEIWESMPTFFMLLFVVAILQSKTIFLVILIIGFFGWTGFSRYIRGEFFKQRHLTYVEACKTIGFSDIFTIFSHILPNAIPPILTLLPFAIMGAITSEAGLSFLGLGEEGSCSWGVLMDEGRQAFPGESHLLWPPAILLTILLVTIALVGDALRDAIDPKLSR
jgi:peptide/nickel transport system permease protein